MDEMKKKTHTTFTVLPLATTAITPQPCTLECKWNVEENTNLWQTMHTFLCNDEEESHWCLFAAAFGPHYEITI